MVNFWGQKSFCVIAGASRGIGQAIARAFAKKVGKDSVLLLLARNKEALQQTRLKILDDPANNCSEVVTTAIDLSDHSSFQSIISGAFKEVGRKESDFEHSILIQCAASLGIDRGLRVDQMDDASYIQNYFDFNITSFILLNSAFCKVVADEGRQTSIVHITSHGAVDPYKTWGLYCAARAAKEMLLRSIALESPHIQTLNYAPGVVDTENYAEALRHTADKELVKAFEEERAQGRLLTPQKTAEKLVEILESKRFVKGEHVSYDLQL